MGNKVIAGIMFTLLFVSMLTLAFNIQPVKAEPKTWTVDDDGPADFHTIQEAINAANPEDTIYVYNGTYYEHLTISKNDLKLIGENRETTIIHATRVESILIKLGHELDGVSGVVIKNFTLKFPDEGWNNWPICGVRVTNSVIAENIIADDTHGMEGPGLTHGIYLVYSSENNTIRGNIISNVADTGIYFDNSGGGNEIYENTIEGSGWYGVQIQGSFQKGPDKFYHNNLIGNYHQVDIYDPSNVVHDVWDDGYPSGGNYWSDYNGVDFHNDSNQDQLGSDGIGDIPYILDDMNEINGNPPINKDGPDRYPLMNPWNIPPPSPVSTKLYVDPPIIKAFVNETFTVNIMIDNVTDLYFFEFKLGYTTAFLDIVNISVHSFLNEPMFIVKNETRESLGRYWLVITSLKPAEPKNGSGALVTITFKVTSKGTCVLYLYDTKLSNKKEPIPHEVVNGYFIDPIPGDINIDGIVDIFDIATVAVCFDAEHGKLPPPETQPYNPNADLNDDGIIDIFDIATVAINFGKKGL